MTNLAMSLEFLGFHPWQLTQPRNQLVTVMKEGAKSEDLMWPKVGFRLSPLLTSPQSLPPVTPEALTLIILPPSTSCPDQWRLGLVDGALSPPSLRIHPQLLHSSSHGTRRVIPFPSPWQFPPLLAPKFYVQLPSTWTLHWNAPTPLTIPPG